MGQRLNIEIWNNGKVLANAYYHWSAYSKSAAELAREIIYYIPDAKADNDILKAIKLLEKTGARMTEAEVERAKEIEELTDVLFDTNADRNDGLISVTEEGINETRNWQEGALYIYLDEERIKFDVIYKSKRWEWEKEQKECNDNPKVYRDLEKVNVSFDDIKFKDIDRFNDFVSDHEMEPFVSVIDPDYVIDMIA